MVRVAGVHRSTADDQRVRRGPVTPGRPGRSRRGPAPAPGRRPEVVVALAAEAVPSRVPTSSGTARRAPTRHHADSASRRTAFSTSSRSSGKASRPCASLERHPLDLGDLDVGVGQLTARRVRAGSGGRSCAPCGRRRRTRSRSCPSGASTRPRMPVSSSTSRTAACSCVSPGSTWPFGQRPHQPTATVPAGDERSPVRRCRDAVDDEAPGGGLLHRPAPPAGGPGGCPCAAPPRGQSRQAGVAEAERRARRRAAYPAPVSVPSATSRPSRRPSAVR